jgi:hypothetical protein
VFQVRDTSNYNLTYINQQLAMLKEKMVKEQMRLNTLIVNKDLKIKSQNDQIIKMKSLIRCQKSKSADIPEKTCLSIKVENERLHDFYAQGKSHTTSLKRQPKFTKGSERPKFHNSMNKMRPAMSCQNLSTLTQVKGPYDSPPNPMASSCENLSSDSTKTAILTRKTLNMKLHSDIISDKDSGFGSFRSDKLTNLDKQGDGLNISPTVTVGANKKLEENRGILKTSWAFVETNNNNNYEDKSAQKYSAQTEKCKRRERRKTVSIQLHHLPVSVLST